MQPDGQLDTREIKSREGKDKQGQNERDASNCLDGGVRDRLGVEAFALDGEQQPAASDPTSSAIADRRERRKRESGERLDGEEGW